MKPSIPKTVLYVEDNPVNIFLVQAIFEPGQNVQLITATHGNRGLAAARTQRPDLILLDLNLPDMDGAEFLTHLRADPTIASIPVVIVSADAMDDQFAHYRSLGAADYLSKPFDLDQFERMVDRYLSKPIPSQ